MEVLLVHCFDESSRRGQNNRDLFLRTVQGQIEQSIRGKVYGQVNYTIRAMDELHELVCDWENDILNEDAKYITTLFDKIDIIFVGGDTSNYPWSPKATQLVTLIHMANHTKKPLFGCGFGAFVSLYASSTQGTKFYILNGDDGDSIRKINEFDKYTSAKKCKYPGGYLDNETGDIYTYNPDSKMWLPQCNIGMYKNASTGKPSSKALRPTPKTQSRNTRLLSFDQNPEAIDDHEQIVYIKTKMLQHWAVKNFTAPAFVAAIQPDWYINEESSLPSSIGLTVIADDYYGAVMWELENKLLVAIDICDKKTAVVFENILRNFLTYMINEIISAPQRIDTSLNAYLFGSDGFGGSYNSSHRKNMEKPLSSKAIKSSLIKGPSKVTVPNINKLFTSDITSQVDYFALLKDKAMFSTIGKKPFKTMREPEMSRDRRLSQFLEKANGSNDNNLIQKLKTMNIDESSVKYSLEQSIASGSYVAMPDTRQNKPNHRPQTAGAVRKSTGHQSDHNMKSNNDKGDRKMSTMLNSHRLPSAHPVPDVNLATLPMKQSHRVDAAEAVYIDGVHKPFSNIKKYNALTTKDITDSNGEYKGMYNQVYLSPHERIIHEDAENKKKFISEKPFLTSFGVRSAIPLREEAQIRPHGQYPGTPDGYHAVSHLPASDWNIVRCEDKAKRVAGEWQN